MSIGKPRGRRWLSCALSVAVASIASCTQTPAPEPRPTEPAPASASPTLTASTSAELAVDLRPYPFSRSDPLARTDRARRHLHDRPQPGGSRRCRIRSDQLLPLPPLRSRPWCDDDDPVRGDLLRAPSHVRLPGQGKLRDRWQETSAVQRRELLIDHGHVHLADPWRCLEARGHRRPLRLRGGASPRSGDGPMGADPRLRPPDPAAAGRES